MSRHPFPRLGRWISALLALGLLGVVLVRPWGGVSSAVDRATPLSPAAARRDAPIGHGAPALHEVATMTERATASLAGTGPFRLRIVDEDARPIRGATAWVEGEEALRRSDAAGELRFAGSVRRGFVGAPGFLPARFTISERPGALRMRGLQVLELERDPGLDLTVLWSDGTPVVGASVELHHPEIERARVPLPALVPPVAATDTQGRTLVVGHRLGGATAHLFVQPPESDPVWVLMGLAPAQRGERPAFTAHLPRDVGAHHVRVVDASGAPLAGHRVHMRYGVEESARTDAEGFALFPARLATNANVSGGPARYAVEFEGSWWYEEREQAPLEGTQVELIVAPTPIHGRILSPSPESYLVASIAAVFSDANETRWTWSRDSLLDLRWHPVGSDGRFADLAGAQGRVTLVAVRHREHDAILNAVRVPAGGGPVEIEVPDVCRVTIELSRTPDPGTHLSLHPDPTVVESAATGSVRIRRSLGAMLKVSLRSTRQVVELPRASYRCETFTQGAELSHETLDANAATATLEIDLPSSVRVSGEVFGTLRGSLANLALEVESEDGRITARTRTDVDGRFELDLPARDAIFVRPVWSGGRTLMGLRPRDVFDPPMQPAGPAARYEVEEALLRIAEVPPSPLLAGHRLKLQRIAGPGEAGRGGVDVALDDLRRAELYLPPGNYRIERRLDNGLDQSLEVALAVGEERDAVLECAAFAVIGIDVDVSEPERRELRLRVHDTQGAIIDFAYVRRIDAGPHAYREVVTPGTYTVEIQSFPRGSRLSDEPLDTWRGEVRPVPGALAPLRVFLR